MASSGSTAWQSADHALGPDRRGVDVEIGPRELLPRRLPFLDLGVPGFERIAALGRAALQLGQQLAQEGARVGEDAEVGRIVAAELVRVDVDVDQLGVREIPRVAGIHDEAERSSKRAPMASTTSAWRPASLAG